MIQRIGKKTLLDFVHRIEAEGGICFSIWNEEKQKVVDYKLSGCTPTGKDGCTRIGLTPIVVTALTVQDLTEYSIAHDRVMNTPLKVVHGVYMDNKWNKKPYSIKIPDSVAKITIHQLSDGDQPSYASKKIEQAIRDAKIDYHTIADYPRHGDTLRLLFADQETAEKALVILQSIV